MAAEQPYKALREALDSLVTPGPWGWDERRGAMVRTSADQVPGDPFVVLGPGTEEDPDLWVFDDDAVYLAAADPSTVGALLAERDALAAELQRRPVGTCGDISPKPTSGLGGTCTLLAGHDGWHEDDTTEGPLRWIEADALAGSVSQEPAEEAAQRDRGALLADYERMREALEAIAAPDSAVAANEDALSVQAYRRCVEQAKWALAGSVPQEPAEEDRP